MSDPDYKRPGDEPNVWRKTSNWRTAQVEILRAHFVNVAQMFGEQQQLSQCPGSDWIELAQVQDVRNPPDGVPLIGKIFMSRLVQLQDSADESVDMIASDLLTYSGYESGVLHFRPRPHLEINWRHYIISSVPDFCVYSDHSRIQPLEQYLVVVGDKPERRVSLTKVECQLYGEMFVAASIRYQVDKTAVVMFGMLLVGPYVRFYRANFPAQYFEDIEAERRPSVPVNVERYPSNAGRGLSLVVRTERATVVRTLLMIRHQVESMLSE